MKPFPDSADQLLDELIRRVPERPSTPKTSREEDVAHGAQRELVLSLIRWRDEARREIPLIPRRPRR